LPIELVFEINSKRLGGLSTSTSTFYDLPVFEYYTGSQKEQIDFLVNCQYDFFSSSTEHQPESSIAINGNLLKLREQKYNSKIAIAIEKAKRSYKHMDFFKRMAKDPKTQIQNVIVDQNKWLKVLQDEQPLF
jgi:hypothetical protein